MSDEVVTTLTIEADTSGADQFAQAMTGAEQAANQSLSGMNVSFLAIGAGAVAALASIKGVVDYVVGANKDLADMQTIAKQVGLTLADFQGIKLGGAISGLNDSQINSGLEKSASLLNDAQRNANSLSKELDANGISIKNANGQLISQNQLLGIAADLIKNAKPGQDQVAIAQMLGFTKEWIPLLEQGGAAMSGLTAEAQAAGGIIDDATIKKAAEFNTEWTKSSAIFSVTMKAALADLLPFVDELIQRAQKFADIKPGAGLLDGLTQAVAGGTLRQLATTDLEVKSEVSDSWSKLSETVYTLYAFFRAAADDPAIHKGIENLIPSTPEFLSNNSVYKMNSVFPDSPDPMNSDGYKKTGPLNYDALQKQIDAADDAAGDAADAYTKVAGRGKDTNDAVDKAINTLNRHTLQTVADTQAVGLGAGALATFRAEAAETAAIQANGGEITAKQKAQFDALTVSAGLAADALAKAKVSSDIQFSGGSSLLSSEDTKIAQQLKGIYGNDIPAALDSSYAAAIRVNDAFKEVSSGIENSMVSSLTDITTGAKSASQGFTDMSNAIIKAIEQMIIKITIVEPLMRSMQLLMSGGLGGMGITYGLPGTAGSNLFGPVAPSAHGNVFAGGNIIPFAQGGVIDGPHVAPMALMGEAGPEAIVPLRRGADGNLGIASAGGGGKAPTIVINNHTDAQPQVSQGSNGDMTITLKKMVDGAVGDSLSSGTGMRVLNKQYGVKQFAGQ